MHRCLLTLALLAVPALAATQSAEKPLIGITTNVRERGDTPSLSVTYGSSQAVIDAGGLPFLFSPIENVEDIERLAGMADGFVFTGGADIDPARYGEEKHKTTNLNAPLRDQFEQELMRAALARGKPVLGLCLGMQQLCVASGGSLVQDIASETASVVRHRGASAEHEIAPVEGTRLADLLGVERMTVHSSHHQAVDEPGEGVIISARSPDGIIEGIEIPDHPFAVGVQWHPEHAQETEPNRRIFEGFVEAARASRTSRD
jgi:putative glutamine amidotransferase